MAGLSAAAREPDEASPPGPREPARLPALLLPPPLLLLLLPDDGR